MRPNLEDGDKTPGLVFLIRIFKATVNWLQMQHAQAVSLPAHYQALTDNAKLYEPGECYADFVRNLPKNLHKDPLHLDSASSDNTRYQPPAVVLTPFTSPL